MMSELVQPCAGVYITMVFPASSQSGTMTGPTMDLAGGQVMR